MKILKCFMAASLALAVALPAAAQTSAEQIHNEAKLTLHFFGLGYAAGQLGVAAPPFSAQDDKPRPVKLAHGDMSVIGSAKDHTLAASRLKLTQGDFRELGLTIGVTPVDALMRQFGKPEKQDSHRLIYRGISEICVDQMTFFIDKGLLRAIEWDWCHD